MPKVVLRWKQIQGEEEAFPGAAGVAVGRMPKSANWPSKSPHCGADSGYLGLTEPDVGLQHRKLNELEEKEIRLMQIANSITIYGCAVPMWMICVMPSHKSGALLELRIYQPFNFKTGKFSELRWMALLLPTTGKLILA
ncbi:MAG: hypothetical protein R3F44_03295 [Candidatus Competibacteraceae bacterium]